jgi:polyhydroxyalkanoate synthase
MWKLAPFGVDDHDNPETLRFKKYATGAHLVLQGDGIQTGQTTKEVVWEKDKVRLYRYQSSVEKRFPVPVLLVYALILRPYILDLVPGHSFVEYLLGEGFDVYLLDWGVPGDEDSNLSFENYVLDYLPGAVERVLESSRAERLTQIGRAHV